MAHSPTATAVTRPICHRSAYRLRTQNYRQYFRRQLRPLAGSRRHASPPNPAPTNSMATPAKTTGASAGRAATCSPSRPITTTSTPCWRQGNTAGPRRRLLSRSNLPATPTFTASRPPGPIYVPHVFNLKNKVFWSLSYNGEHDAKPETLKSYPHVVPSAPIKPATSPTC